MTAQDHWTREEIQAWLDANLSTKPDYKRWVLQALRLLKGLPVPPDALLAEAILRACDGVRNFNRGHSIAANLYGTMRSIASSWHKAKKRRPEISLEDLLSSEDEGQDPLEVLVTPQGQQASPEAEMQFQQEIGLILKVFDDREDAQLVILGRTQGLRGAALAEAADLEPADLPSVQRLISRRLAAYRRET